MKHEEFIINNEQADQLINRNFEEFPEVQKGIWILFQRDYRHIFYKFDSVSELEDFVQESIALSVIPGEVRNVWVYGEVYNIKLKLIYDFCRKE